MKQNLLFDKRRIYLVLYVLLAGALLIASYYYSTKLEYSLLENVYVNLKDQTDQQNRIIRSKISAQINAVTILSDALPLIPDFPNQLPNIAPKYNFNTDYEHLFYINPSGIGQAPLVGHVNISEESYFNQLLAGNTIMAPVKRFKSGFTFFIIAPIVQNGTLLGFLANEVDSTYLYATMEGIIDGDIYMYLLDGLGNTIALANTGYALQTKDTLPAFLQNVQFSQFNTDFIGNVEEFHSFREEEIPAYLHVNFHNQIRLGYMTPIGIQAWTLVAFQPMETVSSVAFEIQRNFYLFTVASLIVVGLFLCYIIIVSARNQSLKENLIRELTTRADIDPLTKVYTKAETEARISTYLKFTHDTAVSGLLCIDIDNFQEVNLAYGAEYSDVILKEIAHNIKRSFRSTDIVGRTGGTQFVVLIHKIQTKELVELKAKQVTKAINKVNADRTGDKVITASIGIAMCPQNAINYKDLYKNADAAMFYAKNNGKNSYIFYDKGQKLNVKRITAEQNEVEIKEHSMNTEKLESILVSLLYGAQDTRLALSELTRRIAENFTIAHCLIIEYNLDNKELSLISEYTEENNKPLFMPMNKSIQDKQLDIEPIINSKSTIQEYLDTSPQNENDMARFLGEHEVQSAVILPYNHNAKNGFFLLASNNKQYKWQRNLYPSMAFFARLYSIYKKEH